MCNWRNWILPGLLTVALLTAAAFLFRLGPVETDLASRANEALKAAHPWASVEMDGRDASLAGSAPTSQDAAAAAELARGVHGMRVVADGSALLPLADPYLFSAVRDATGLTLTGHAPSEAARSAIAAAAAAAFPGVEIANKLELTRGAPEGHDSLVAFGLEQLSRLSAGELSLANTEMTLTGAAATSEGFAALTSALNGALPAGGRLAGLTITPPPVAPYAFGAERTGSTVTLTGYVPDAATRSALLEAARGVVSGGTVEDKLQFASGAAEGFGEIARFGIEQLSRLDPGGIAVNDVELSVSGTATGPAQFDAATAALRGSVPGKGIVASRQITPAQVSPFTWSVTQDATAVLLEGFAPSASDREALGAAAAAAFPGKRIDNLLALAGGLPAGIDWGQASGFVMEQMKGLSAGKAEISGTSMNIRGEALTGETHDAVRSALGGAIPGGLRVASADITLPVADPYTWSLSRPETGNVQISGFVPDAATRTANAAAAAALANGAAIGDSQKLARGAPAAFADAALASIRASQGLISSNANIAGTKLTFVGEAASEEAAAAARALIGASALSGFDRSVEITVRTPPAAPVVEPKPAAPAPAAVDCQAVFNEILASGVIRFQTRSAELSEDSLPLLDQLAKAAETCPQARIEIGGHTDSDGSDERNLVLSEARANSVLAYLSQVGVARDRLTARGYGETQPIADNATAEGKARNRRIELRIVD